MTGWIFGNSNEKQWTQVLFGKKYRFQNPLHQNYKHTKAVQKLLGVNHNLIISIVVFVGKSEFKTEMPGNVLKLSDLLPYIRSYDSVILSNEDFEVFSEKLNNPVLCELSDHKNHIRNVQNNLQNPVCPRCGKPMVLRIARMSGEEFWGCSGFPRCKATKRVD